MHIVLLAFVELATLERVSAVGPVPKVHFRATFQLQLQFIKTW